MKININFICGKFRQRNHLIRWCLQWQPLAIAKRSNGLAEIEIGLPYMFFYLYTPCCDWLSALVLRNVKTTFVNKLKKFPRKLRKS